MTTIQFNGKRETLIMHATGALINGEREKRSKIELYFFLNFIENYLNEIMRL
jgi:hypothetical protein